MEEIFVPVVYIDQDGNRHTFPRYDVSNLGRVRSNEFCGKIRTKYLKYDVFHDAIGDYYRVELWKNGKKKKVRVHRLVMSSFKEHEYFPGAVVDHIDNVTTHNELQNLRWITNQQNTTTDHALEMRHWRQTNHPSISKKVKATNLKTGEVTTYPSGREFGRIHGVSCNYVSVCIKKFKGNCKKINMHIEYYE